MKDNDLGKKLRGVDLPDVKLPEAKARLRRELLTSPDFEMRASRRRRFLRMRYGLAALATVVVVGLIAIQFVPKRLSAKALIETMEAAYESGVVSTAVHYIRQSLTLMGDRNFEVERWDHPDAQKIRIRLKDVNTGDVLAHSIIDGQRMYGVETPAGEVRGMIEKAGARHGSVPHDRGTMALVIMRVDSNDEWGDETVVQALVMNDGFDRDRFASKTPRAIVSDLAGSPDVTYAGSSIEPRLDQKIEILERRNAGTLPFKLEFPMKHLEQVKWFLDSIISREISLEMDTKFVEFLEHHDLVGEVKIKPIESVETVEVLAETSQIHRVTLAVFEKGVETYRAEKTFLEDRYLSYSPDMFDPEHHGMTAVPDTNKGSIK